MKKLTFAKKDQSKIILARYRDNNMKKMRVILPKETQVKVPSSIRKLNSQLTASELIQNTKATSKFEFQQNKYGLEYKKLNTMNNESYSKNISYNHLNQSFDEELSSSSNGPSLDITQNLKPN